jgi:hypothetical protein
MEKISGWSCLRKGGPGREDGAEAEPDPQANIGERRPPSNGFGQAYLDCAGGRDRGFIVWEDGFRR